MCLEHRRLGVKAVIPSKRKRKRNLDTDKTPSIAVLELSEDVREAVQEVLAGFYEATSQKPLKQIRLLASMLNKVLPSNLQIYLPKQAQLKKTRERINDVLAGVLDEASFGRRPAMLMTVDEKEAILASERFLSQKERIDLTNYAQSLNQYLESKGIQIIPEELFRRPETLKEAVLHQLASVCSFSEYLNRPRFLGGSGDGVGFIVPGGVQNSVQQADTYNAEQELRKYGITLNKKLKSLGKLTIPTAVFKDPDLLKEEINRILKAEFPDEFQDRSDFLR